MQRSVIQGIGGYLPKKIVTNQDLEQSLDTSDAWIQQRTGIKQRHIASQEETTAYMAFKAAAMAMEDTQCDPLSIDLIILATVSPDHIYPATAAKVQHMLGAKNAVAFDINAVCSGFVYALSVADSMIKNGAYKKALIIGADRMSALVDWQDRTTCVLFGDGAGAVLIEKQEDQNNRGIYSSHLHTDGSGYNDLYADFSTNPNNVGCTHMNGPAIFKNAVKKIGQAVQEALIFNELSVNDIHWFIPHQANKRIIDGVADLFHIPKEKMITTVDKHANTSAASIPLALWVACQDGRIQKNEWLILEAMGGGLTWGSVLLKY